MQISWIIIGAVAIGAIGLIVYLIRENRKDEKDVMKHFNKQASNFHDEESELNDEK
jgi:hypothetical protein